MSDEPQQPGWMAQFSGRWQIPLLILSGILLALAIWNIRPEPEKPSFEQQYQYAQKLKNAEMYQETIAQLEQMLQDPQWTEAEKRRLHALMVEVIADHEAGNLVHGEVNARRILEHSEQSLAAGESPDAGMHRIRGLAWQWLNNAPKALVEFKKAIDKGIENTWPLHKWIIQIERGTDRLSDAELHERYSAFVEADDCSEELVYWSAEEKVKLYGRQGRHDDCVEFLKQHKDRITGGDVGQRYTYLRALALFNVGCLGDAERLLRQLRDADLLEDELYAASGYLLGRVLLDRHAPEYALSFFDDVQRNTLPSKYRAACVWGRAEALARLQRYEQAQETFQEAIDLAARDKYGTMIDLQAVREFTAQLYKALKDTDRLETGRKFLRIAARLAKPGSIRIQARYANWLAESALELGQQTMAQADEQDSGKLRQQARDYYSEAGEEYLRLAKLLALDVGGSTQAIRRAVEAFDRAGQHRKQIAVLKALGKAQQAIGEYEQAIETYQHNLTHYPRIPAAAASLIPLAECFRSIGELDKAEQTLLRIVDRRPSDPVEIITPEAKEFRQALFMLGDLYMDTERYEQAIARYKETLDRYGADERQAQIAFRLAEACRKSAVRIREEDLPDPHKVPYKENLRRTYRERLAEAGKLYDWVLALYNDRSAEEMGQLDRLYEKLSWFYRADMVYDRSRVEESPDLAPFRESLEMYDKAAWRYREDPMALSAYVQMISCYLRIGKVDKARQMLQRAHHVLRIIPEEAFERYAPQEDREYWKTYLQWLQQTPVFGRQAVALAD